MKILLVHLVSFGDCLMATTLVKQIKKDWPSCHLIWAISDRTKEIADENPLVDEIWEVKIDERNSPFEKAWIETKALAEERKKKGELDLIFYTQLLPDNLWRFDGTTRTSTLSAYPRKYTVSFEPVVHLSKENVSNAKKFVNKHNLESYDHVILAECTPSTEQSFIHPELIIEVAQLVLADLRNAIFVLSSHLDINTGHKRIVCASNLSFKENAELSKYATLFIGCSSGISWLLTSTAAKKLPMIQFLHANAQGFSFASLKYDHEYLGIPHGHILETSVCKKDQMAQIILGVIYDFRSSYEKYNVLLRPDLRSLVDFLFHLFKGEPKGFKTISRFRKRNRISLRLIIPILSKYGMLYLRPRLIQVLRKSGLLRLRRTIIELVN